MAIIKCAKCGEEYDSFYSVHTCKVEEQEKGRKEKQKWETSTKLKRIFLYDPDTPWLVRVVALAWLLPTIGGLFGFTGIILLIKEVILEGKAELLATYIYLTAVSMAALFISYGLSHLKRWSLYLYAALLVFIFLATGYVFFGLLGILGFILVAIDYKKFH